MNSGFELRESSAKGEGVYATTSFKAGDTVMVGVVDRLVDGNNSHASQIGENQFVIFKGLINQVNHSCDPTCGVRVTAMGAHEFVAKRDIRAGEELTFDYALSNYTIDHFPKRCMCGSSTCRGTITGWKDLPLDKKKADEDFVAPYLLELDARKSFQMSPRDEKDKRKRRSRSTETAIGHGIGN